MTDDARAWVMPVLIDRYLGDTSLLTTEEHGAYFLLLMAMWKAGGTLPDNDTKLASAAKLSLPRWRKLKPALWGFFRSDGAGGIFQKRLHAELDRVQTKSENGKKAARSRWQSDAEADAKTMRTHMPTGMPNTMPTPMQNSMRNGMPNPMPEACLPDPDPMAPDFSPSSDEDSEKSLAERAPTQAGEACKAMREAGIAEVNPNNPDLRAMLEQGMTISELVSASVIAINSHAEKPFKYALKVARSERVKSASREALPAASKNAGIARFMRPPGTPSVLPDDDLGNAEAHHVHDAQSRG